MGMKVTKDEYEAFLKDYAWELLQQPDYRLGQAFLNFFPSVNNEYANDGDHGALEAQKLYYSTYNESQAIINKWLE
jgi:hypothetical protein